MSSADLIVGAYSALLATGGRSLDKEVVASVPSRNPRPLKLAGWLQGVRLAEQTLELERASYKTALEE